MDLFHKKVSKGFTKLSIFLSFNLWKTYDDIDDLQKLGVGVDVAK